jgi:DNA-binding transcriptional ArsR family regulator
MRALAHPVRLAILEHLTLEGTLTATQAAERVGESPSACSFHLRQLAKYGFVEEAGRGAGRERPWRAARLGFSLDRVHPDTETTVAAAGLENVLVSRFLAELQDWYRTSASYPNEWQEAAHSSSTLAYLTAEELRELDRELAAVVEPYRDRIADKGARPPGSRPVQLLRFAFPKGAG